MARIVSITRGLLFVTSAAISAMGLFCLIALFVLGIPTPEKAAADYANRLCRLVKGTIDPHLPCIGSDGAQIQRPTDREALWSVVKTLCVPASFIGVNFPCLKVDRNEGYAIIKSPVKGRLDFVFTPTTKVAGVESLVSGAGGYPNLWRIAWRERGLLQQSSNRSLDWDAVALAVNSRSTRSQDQLHIHLGCINSALREFLAAQKFPTRPQWLVLRPDSITSGVFLKLLPGDGLDQDIFRSIFDEIPGGKTFAEKETIAVAGVTRGVWRGFALMVTLEPMPAEALLAAAC